MDDFDLEGFMPYLLNRAAEQSSAQFQRTYKARYGMLRTEWRVLFHLGRYGPQTAKAVCDRAALHKTKVSRAVRALEAKRYLARQTVVEDRRQEILTLTAAGNVVFQDLVQDAQRFDTALLEGFGDEEIEMLRGLLRRLAGGENSSSKSFRAR